MPRCCSFQKLSVVGTLDCNASQEVLDQLAQAVERRCVVAATLRRVQGGHSFTKIMAAGTSCLLPGCRSVRKVITLNEL